jgi:hypothetical protein
MSGRELAECDGRLTPAIAINHAIKQSHTVSLQRQVSNMPRESSQADCYMVLTQA